VTLTVAMIEASFRALLVTAVGLATLVKACLLAAGKAAIALSAITAGAQKENGAAFAAQANPQPENNLALARHARSAGTARHQQLIRVTLKSSLFVVARRGCHAGTPAVGAAGFHSQFPPFTLHYTVRRIPKDDQTDDSRLRRG
jgi:hypothetical protein